MKAKLRKILPYAGYPAFYLFCLVIFAYFTFPYEMLRDRIVAEYERSRGSSTTGETQRLDIESIEPYWLSGIRAVGIRLVTTKPPANPDEKPKRSALDIDEAYARVQLLPLLLGRTSVSFGADLFGGTVEGVFARTGSEERLKAELSGLDLAFLTPFLPASALPMGGILEGKVDFVLPERKLQKANGLVDLTIYDSYVGDGKAKIQGALALPRMNLGDLVLSAEANEGVLKLGKVATSGRDLEFSMEGKLTLRDPFAESIYDMQLRFKLADAYRTRNEVTKSLFGSPDSKVPPLFEMDPKVKQSKRADGFYSWQISGLFRAPQLLPAPLRR